MRGFMIAAFISCLNGTWSQYFDYSGYTGQLVLEYISKTYPTGLKWAIVGRDGEKLKSLHKRLNLSESIKIIVADSSGFLAHFNFITSVLSITFLFFFL
jgi:hypothetical protein